MEVKFMIFTVPFIFKRKLSHITYLHEVGNLLLFFIENGFFFIQYIPTTTSSPSTPPRSPHHLSSPEPLLLSLLSEKIRPLGHNSQTQQHKIDWIMQYNRSKNVPRAGKEVKGPHAPTIRSH